MAQLAENESKSPAIYTALKQLLLYAKRHGLAEEEDFRFLRNALIEALGLTEWVEPDSCEEEEDLEVILRSVLDYAAASGVLAENSVAYRDLFDTRLMGILTPRPSWVIRRFFELYESSPKEATDWYYAFSKATDYIRVYRIRKDLRWKVPSPYGEIDITINLSKPEKDPKAIAAAKLQKQSGYPKCLLCTENEGFAGSLSKPARQNHRIIPVTLAGEEWFLQYSPYVYYNEHCIVLCKEHRPMKIDRATFARMLDFVTLFPHYFIGSNADLPIVGGSILSHDHMQGGCYTFPMEKAPVKVPIRFRGFDAVESGIVSWPLSVLRLRSADRGALEELSERILLAWRGYTDEASVIYAETDGEPHNTITPIARRRGADYELDLVLRNNLTTPEHPLGLYHPHAEYHNIKKENIGLIEVMGLAVLPARLKEEMRILEEQFQSGSLPDEIPSLRKHADWFRAICESRTVTKENIHAVLFEEIGKTFVHVLEDAGVYKTTPEGLQGFLRFLEPFRGE